MTHPRGGSEGTFNWAFISTSSYKYHGDLFILLRRDRCNTVFHHAAQNHLLDADHNSDDRGRFRTDVVMLGGLMLLILIVAAASRLMPQGTAAETATLHFHLLHDDDLIAKP